ncbi:pyridoxamine 5'-phosphate oxidase family protein [Sphaerimonospora cavernae]|uniref:Pyridoxamine 5'-phosphate oxidase family protein n=1 Tax=Sphaerimonospora cavernae TaxID=1740611 RepID=A0ABV6UBF5_9ACTN
MTVTATGTYHAGERQVQTRAGLREQAQFSARARHRHIPEIARDFLAQQVMLIAGASDEHGSIWVSLLSAPAGFIKVTGDTTLHVQSLPPKGDPLRARFTALDGQPFDIGMIAIEPATRRRMRMNGSATTATNGFHVALEQIYANCPKYIQKRQVETLAEPPGPSPASTTDRLTGAQQALISSADTFFVATADGEGHADASHRGGNPGFVKVLSPTMLRWPDYRGNAMFGTLGNIEVNPAAGLLFPDWESGGCLQLTGTARIDWDTGRTAAVPGAERLIEFTVQRVVEIPDATPLRWTGVEYSRFNPTADRYPTA